MKQNLLSAMIATGKTKFQTTLHSYACRKNPASVVMETADWHDVPAEFLRERDPEVDKAKLKAALLVGGAMPGVAHLEQGERIEIK